MLVSYWLYLVDNIYIRTHFMFLFLFHVFTTKRHWFPRVQWASHYPVLPCPLTRRPKTNSSHDRTSCDIITTINCVFSLWPQHSRGRCQRPRRLTGHIRCVIGWGAAAAEKINTYYICAIYVIILFHIYNISIFILYQDI